MPPECYNCKFPAPFYIIFNDGIEGGVQGEGCGVWPGTLAKRKSQDSYWYYVEVLAGTQLNIIFNNGVDEQINGVLIDDDSVTALVIAAYALILAKKRVIHTVV